MLVVINNVPTLHPRSCDSRVEIWVIRVTLMKQRVLSWISFEALIVFTTDLLLNLYRLLLKILSVYFGPADRTPVNSVVWITVMDEALNSHYFVLLFVHLFFEEYLAFSTGRLSLSP